MPDPMRLFWKSYDVTIPNGSEKTELAENDHFKGSKVNFQTFRDYDPNPTFYALSPDIDHFLVL